MAQQGIRGLFGRRMRGRMVRGKTPEPKPPNPTKGRGPISILEGLSGSQMKKRRGGRIRRAR